MVQVVKTRSAPKAARLSTQISIAGRLLRLSAAGVAHRHLAAIEAEADREHLREKLQQLLPPDFKGGFIVRTMAEAASDRELAADVEYLAKWWKDIQDRARRPRRPRCSTRTSISPSACCAISPTRERAHPDRFTRNVPESRGVRARVHAERRFASRALCGRAARYSTCTASRTKSKKRSRGRVDLKSRLPDHRPDRSADDRRREYRWIRRRPQLRRHDFKTNLEASQVIARQLRLRNLGGIIIIDFIDMDTEEHRNAVLNEFRKRSRATGRG